MLKINFMVTIVAALVPLAVGFIWYNPKVLGTAWMHETGMTREKARSGNMAKTFGLTFVFSIMLALLLNVLVIHQFHLYSILINEPGINEPDSPIAQYLKAFMDQYGNNFRTFKHGMFHGSIAGLFIVFPAIAVNALFEMRSFKYIFINAGFWIVSMMLMGGIICQFT
jgi:hypothetical protein